MEILTSYNRKYKYDYFKGLLQGDFKKLYKNKCNYVFEKKGKELGIWGYWYKNRNFGILNYDNEVAISWCWRNTPNTHPYCFHDFFYFFYDSTGIELDFNDREKWEDNLNILFKFVEQNFELYFTTNIETKYFYHFWFRCNESWTKGQITIIALMYKIKQLFSEYKIINMDFALERGDPNDFIGIDVMLTVVTKDIYKRKEIIKIQVKGGKVINKSETGYLIKGAANDLRAEVDYWCYVDINDNQTEIILFQNLKPYIIRVGYNIFFKNEITHSIIIKESIMVAEKLNEIAKFCFSNKILIEIEHLPGEVNNIIFQQEPEKMINIKIGDFKDENLIKLLENKFVELKKTFQ
jgi:hypothetical protein